MKGRSVRSSRIMPVDIASCTSAHLSSSSRWSSDAARSCTRASLLAAPRLLLRNDLSGLPRLQPPSPLSPQRARRRDSCSRGCPAQRRRDHLSMTPAKHLKLRERSCRGRLVVTAGAEAFGSRLAEALPARGASALPASTALTLAALLGLHSPPDLVRYRGVLAQSAWDRTTPWLFRDCASAGLTSDGRAPFLACHNCPPKTRVALALVSESLRHCQASVQHAPRLRGAYAMPGGETGSGFPRWALQKVGPRRNRSARGAMSRRWGRGATCGASEDS